MVNVFCFDHIRQLTRLCRCFGWEKMNFMRFLYQHFNSFESLKKCLSEMFLHWNGSKYKSATSRSLIIKPCVQKQRDYSRYSLMLIKFANIDVRQRQQNSLFLSFAAKKQIVCLIHKTKTPRGNTQSYIAVHSSLFSFFFFLAVATECEKSLRSFLQSSSENRQVKFGKRRDSYDKKSLLTFFYLFYWVVSHF